jgi:hypothetical protein
MEHQQASPDCSARSTLERIAGSPLGRSRWIQDEVSTSSKCFSASAALTLQLFHCQQVRASAGMLDQFSHPSATIEVLDRGYDRLAFCLGMRKSHGIRQVVIWNIY